MVGIVGKISYSFVSYSAKNWFWDINCILALTVYLTLFSFSLIFFVEIFLYYFTACFFMNFLNHFSNEIGGR